MAVAISFIIVKVIFSYKIMLPLQLQLTSKNQLYLSNILSHYYVKYKTDIQSSYKRQSFFSDEK